MSRWLSRLHYELRSGALWCPAVQREFEAYLLYLNDLFERMRSRAF